MRIHPRCLAAMTPAVFGVAVLVSGGRVQAARADDTQAPAGIGRAAAQEGAGAADVAQAIESAKASKAAGRAGEALNTMTAALKKYPSNADGTKFQITMLLEEQRFPDGLKTYDGYVTARQKPDAVMLAMLARYDLKRTLQAKAGQPRLVAESLERLARDDDADALRTLKQLSASRSSISPEDLAPTIALARLKDAGAEAKLGGLLGAPRWEDRSQVLEAIGQAGARSQVPKVLAALRDPNASVQCAAATALGALQAKEAVPALQTAFKTGPPSVPEVVRMYAAIALKQLGDTTPDAFLGELLGKPLAEVRAYAAQAYRFATSRSPQFEKAVRELQSDPNPLHKLQAAEMLACCDLPSAQRTLNLALADPNPLLRQAAAKIVESRKELADVMVARRVLGDSEEFVRVYGAGIALAAARTAAPPASGGRGRHHP